MDGDAGWMLCGSLHKIKNGEFPVSGRTRVHPMTKGFGNGRSTTVPCSHRSVTADTQDHGDDGHGDECREKTDDDLQEGVELVVATCVGGLIRDQ